MNQLILAYASRFGATSELAAALAQGLESAGHQVTRLNVAEDGTLPGDGQVIVLTAIIWDRPIPPMRDWIKANQAELARRCVAAGVVCGAAGVKPDGGMIYASNLVRRIGAEQATPFALSGRIPDRSDLKLWEWIALKAFAGAMRRPQLFDIEADIEKARTQVPDLVK